MVRTPTGVSEVRSIPFSRMQSKRQGMDNKVLTPDPRLPVKYALPDVLPLELLAARRELVVLLQAPHDDGALRVRQEARRVREVLDDEEGERAREDGREPLEDEDPRPRGLASDPAHVRDGSLRSGAARVSIFSGWAREPWARGRGKERRGEAGRDAHREQTAECTRDGCRAEEDGGPDAKLRAFVPTAARFSISGM